MGVWEAGIFFNALKRKGTLGLCGVEECPLRALFAMGEKFADAQEGQSSDESLFAPEEYTGHNERSEEEEDSFSSGEESAGEQITSASASWCVHAAIRSGEQSNPITSFFAQIVGFHSVRNATDLSSRLESRGAYTSDGYCAAECLRSNPNTRLLTSRKKQPTSPQKTH